MPFVLRVLLSALIFAVPLTASATYHYVDAAAPAQGDGTTWQTAFRDLQDALAIASDGDEIRLAGGRYHPSLSAPLASFYVPQSIVIRGGYAGSAVSSSPDTLDPRNFPTYLDGALPGGGNSRRVVVVDGNARIESVTIRNGLGVHQGGPMYDRGAGLVVHGGSPVFLNVTFRNNRANSSGGAVNIEGQFGANPLGIVEFIECLFLNNASLGDAGVAEPAGGAVFIRPSSPGGVFRFRSSIFENNTVGRVSAGYIAHSSGGAIRFHGNGSTLEVIESSFRGNRSDENGAAILATGTDSSVNIVRSKFAENSALYGGAAVDVAVSTLGIRETTFERNSTLRDINLDNGALVVRGGYSVNLVSNRFVSNHTAGLAAISSALQVHNSLFVGNASAAIRLLGTTLTVGSSTIVGNRNSSGMGLGTAAGIQGNAFQASSVLLDNSVLVGNIGTAATHQISPEIQTIARASLVEHLSEEEFYLLSELFFRPFGNDGALGSQGSDFRLASGSVLLDAGDSSLLPQDVLDLDDDEVTAEELPLDLSGLARVQGAGLDIGAYEGVGLSAPICQADMDKDGSVTVADFFQFLNFFFVESQNQCGFFPS